MLKNKEPPKPLTERKLCETCMRPCSWKVQKKPHASPTSSHSCTQSPVICIDIFLLPFTVAVRWAICSEVCNKQGFTMWHILLLQRQPGFSDCTSRTVQLALTPQLLAFLLPDFCTDWIYRTCICLRVHYLMPVLHLMHRCSPFCFIVSSVSAREESWRGTFGQISFD